MSALLYSHRRSWATGRADFEDARAAGKVLEERNAMRPHFDTAGAAAHRQHVVQALYGGVCEVQRARRNY